MKTIFFSLDFFHERDFLIIFMNCSFLFNMEMDRVVNELFTIKT